MSLPCALDEFLERSCRRLLFLSEIIQKKGNIFPRCAKARAKKLFVFMLGNTPSSYIQESNPNHGY